MPRRSPEPPHDREGRPQRLRARPRARVADPAAARPTRPRSSRSPLARVTPNPYQPRRHMDDAGLEELAASIREHGVLQPVLVTETLDGYQLVAGERRVRAAHLAGLDRIPALVRQLADRDQLEIALVENVQRADLDPIDEATRVPPAHRRVRADPGARRRARRQVARDHRQHAAAARPPRRTSRRRSPRAA